ncbi:hypothetical protein [Paenibacillus chitinolyticus]|uniref:hypothetical protein n=1 Tax=Paenibacillus chitinolyticus TaxID=79263 RepID=UPI001C47EBE6|nr:hypothetical protein [Paenibacillus chitinolyticus]MBV6714891.1 hypothetical protein [Paenibacillus chitinolyticus]
MKNKKFLILTLSAALMLQAVPVFAVEANSEYKETLNKSSEKVKEEVQTPTKEEVLESVKRQLEKQGAERDYEKFAEIINAEYEKNNKNSQAVSPYVDSYITVYMPKGGGESFQSYNGNNYVATHKTQYLSTAVTKDIIYKKAVGSLTTWQDVLITLAGWAVAPKYPVIGNIISAYGATKVIADYLSAEDIRQIQSGTGASKIVTIQSSYGLSTVWIPWKDSPYMTYQENNPYIKNHSYTAY